MILLDTHALLWLHTGNKRGRKLAGKTGGLYASPVTVLELHFLVEVGRVKLRPGSTIAELLDDERWLIDDPPSAALFERASDVSWTRDPFDRLLVGHARMRDWKLATADDMLIEMLPKTDVFEL